MVETFVNSGRRLPRMPSYLVLLTDREWKSSWQEHEQGASINKGDTIKVGNEKWDVLNEWMDLDDVHLVFCVRHPKSEQHRPASARTTGVPWSGTSGTEPRFTSET